MDLVKENKEYLWIKYIRQRIRQNKNFLCLVSGQTGSGKSWSALSICQMLDPDFTIERVIFKGTELMTLINSNKLNKKGVCLNWDEAGIDLSNRSWQSVANKMLNFLLQTFRHRNFVLFFCTPYADFLDSNTRKLFHAEFRTVSIDFNQKKVKLKPQLIEYNSRLSKFYYKYLRVVTKQDGVVPIVSWDVPAPTKELIEQYELKKSKFTNELNQNILHTLNKIEKVDKKPLTELQQQILECIREGVVRQEDIATKLHKKQQQISLNMGFIRRKGYEI